MSGIEENRSVTTVVICGYVRIGVCGCVRDSSFRCLAVRHHMFVQSEQDGYEYCWI